MNSTPGLVNGLVLQEIKGMLCPHEDRVKNLLLAVLVASLAVACQHKVTDGDQANAKPRFIGRFVEEPNGVMRFALGVSTIEARFSGAEATLLLEDVAPKQADNIGNLYDVIVDDAPPKVVAMESGVSRYPIGRFSDGEHTISVIKRTEAWVGEARFRGFDFGKGKLLPPPPARTRRLEFIGDSISAGYGNEGQNEKCPFTPLTENGDLAYGPMTARALNADAVVVAFSGKGVIRNRDGTSQETVPQMYPRTLSNQRDSTWDFKRYTPDAVVVNLGTNDFAQGVPDAAAFQAAYVQFLRSIREHYPNAWLVVGMGPMLSEMYADKQTPMLQTARADIEAVVAKRVADGDKRIQTIEYAMQNGKRGYGCDWHPSLATHAEMAQQLTPVLKSLLHW